MRPIVVFIAFLVTSVSRTALAEDAPAPDAAQIRSWINDLANSMPRREYARPSERLTDEARQALEPVKTAYAHLSRHFLTSLPYLVDSLGDTRFSYPSEHPSSGVFENQSIGAACQRIIDQKLLLRNPILEDHRRIAVWYSLPVDKTWYSRVKSMTLFEMQVDSLDWLLQQPPLRGVPKERWLEKLADVRQFRNEFVAKGKPIDKVLFPPIEGK